MIKTALLLPLQLVAFAAPGAALAGPYVNVEANSGFSGTDYVGTTTDAHVATLEPLVSSTGMPRSVLAMSPRRWF